MTSEAKCPFAHHGSRTRPHLQSNTHWWPYQLNLGILRQQDSKSDSMGRGFNYAEAFSKLDLNAVKKDLTALMTDSQD